jgi:hypothetical protein
MSSGPRLMSRMKPTPLAEWRSCWVLAPYLGDGAWRPVDQLGEHAGVGRHSRRGDKEREGLRNVSQGGDVGAHQRGNGGVNGGNCGEARDEGNGQPGRHPPSSGHGILPAEGGGADGREGGLPAHEEGGQDEFTLFLARWVSRLVGKCTTP